jgi:hypothetical protein
MPLDFIPAPRRIPLFRLFFGLTIAFFAVFSFLDQPLRAPAAPSGIVSFELARTPEAASAMLEPPGTNRPACSRHSAWASIFSSCRSTPQP